MLGEELYARDNCTEFIVGQHFEFIKERRNFEDLCGLQHSPAIKNTGNKIYWSTQLDNILYALLTCSTAF